MKKHIKSGSALIMTIVLTVMLAAVAVMFVAVARMDKASTSNIAANKMLDSAAMSIVELINEQLIYDVPGVAKMADVCEVNFPQYFDYKDYPDACDPWLASIEPYYDDTVANQKDRYKWHQISDVTGYLREKNYPVRNIRVKPVGLGGNYDVVREYPLFGIDVNGVLLDKNGNEASDGVSADADGDGIADSKWIDISNLRTSAGRVFAAIRIIDNGGMVNVNTAYQFNPTLTDPNKIDGTSQMQINLDEAYKGLLKNPDIIKTLHDARRGSPTDPNVEANLIWDFNNFPENGYQPFDSSDELELRNRYCVNSKFKSRVEKVLENTIDSNLFPTEGHLYDGRTKWGIDAWFARITDTFDPNNDRDRRHLLTTYNCDRLIAPDGNDMININDANATVLYKFFKSYNPYYAGQIAVNIQDYRDDDSIVSVLPIDGNTYYGFETPCIYISEIAYNKVDNDTSEPNSYAIELYKPYKEDSEPNRSPEWKLSIGGIDYDFDWPQYGSEDYLVLKWADPGAPLNSVAGTTQEKNIPTEKVFSDTGSKRDILLLRKVSDVHGYVVVDKVRVPNGFTTGFGEKYLQRDISKHKCIRALWSADPFYSSGTLGANNAFESNDADTVQAHPANKAFKNIGEIGQILKDMPYYKSTDIFPSGILARSSGAIREFRIKYNLADPNFQSAFKYLTAMACSDANDRVKGRININTAPVSVLAQLPWVSQRSTATVPYSDPNLAKAVVAYRDCQKINDDIDYTDRDPCGFDNIGQLMNVFNNNPSAYSKYDIRYYALNDEDQKGFPDLSTPSQNEGDGAIDDFEERDLIFARISDLVTVRSDVFTAYILVRVGTEGPQKRYVAILDRSEVRKSGDKVKIRSFQLVPDAR